MGRLEIFKEHTARGKGGEDRGTRQGAVEGKEESGSIQVLFIQYTNFTSVIASLVGNVTLLLTSANPHSSGTRSTW